MATPSSEGRKTLNPSGFTRRSNNMARKIIVVPDSEDDEVVVNRGTGAGGAGTNKTGLTYEARTDLVTNYSVVKTAASFKIIKFAGSDKLFTTTSKAGLFKTIAPSPNVVKAHGCKQPDECYIDYGKRTIFILEKKFQQCSGSVCEKIQTADFKRRHYRKTFPDYKVEYFYCLSDWYKGNCVAELEYLEEIGIPVFWGSDADYKKNVTDFMLNY